MSERPWHERQCPKCGDSYRLDVAARVWVRLTANGSDADESNDGNHEWDSTSDIRCNACGNVGKVAEFKMKEQEDD